MIYFVTAREVSRVKIGHSVKPFARLSQQRSRMNSNAHDGGRNLMPVAMGGGAIQRPISPPISFREQAMSITNRAAGLPPCLVAQPACRARNLPAARPGRNALIHASSVAARTDSRFPSRVHVNSVHGDDVAETQEFSQGNPCRVQHRGRLAGEGKRRFGSKRTIP